MTATSFRSLTHDTGQRDSHAPAPAKHQPVKTATHTPATSTETGSTTAGAVTAPSSTTTASNAPAPTASCAPHDHGHHFGWAHRKRAPKHDGCG